MYPLYRVNPVEPTETLCFSDVLFTALYIPTDGIFSLRVMEKPWNKKLFCFVLFSLLGFGILNVLCLDGRDRTTQSAGVQTAVE